MHGISWFALGLPAGRQGLKRHPFLKLMTEDFI
jgi:hypothetical protein